MSLTIEQAAVTLSDKYKASGHVPTKILAIWAGTESEAPAIIAEVHLVRWSALTDGNAETLYPECALGVGWEGHRCLIRRRGVVLGDSGPIA